MQLIEILQSLSKMGSLRVGLLGFFIWISMTQIRITQAQAQCGIITSVTSTSATSFLIQWNSYSGATNYFLDLRVVNSTTVAPVVVTLPAYTNQKEVFGMKPSTLYTVAVKVYQFYTTVCQDVRNAMTVPGTSQFISGSALSSTAITLQWETVTGVDQYLIQINSTASRYNFTYVVTSAVIKNLLPSTSYDCYVTTVNAGGLGARSSVRTVITLVQPPVWITVNKTGSQNIRITWQPVASVLLYKVTVTDSNGTQIVSSIISSTFLDMQNVLPCSVYQIAVSSVNTFLQPGESRQFNYTTSSVSPVTSISVNYNCLTASADVSWGASFGAESYRVTAVSRNITKVSCFSNGTSCKLTNLACGGAYVVYVTSIANKCETTSNTTGFFQTVPCSPANLQLFRECSSNVIIFSWAPTNNTAFYMAHAVDSFGVTQDCLTTDTSCFFTNTECGRNYNFSVYSVIGQCNGAVSPSVQIRTAPCQPTNMTTSSDCHSNILTCTWDASDGALGYIVQGLGTNGNGSHYSCSSMTDSCVIPGVSCGESLTMQITAFDNECSSQPALGEDATTVPCAPTNVYPVVNCDPSSLTLTWSGANGALFYIATATDKFGGTYTCTSVDLGCQISGLLCGTVYSVSVISTNIKCNSSLSDIVTMATAPCAPSQVQAILDCAGNQALVSWLGTQGTATYTAVMQDQSGGLLSCNTTSSSCWVPNLKCNQLYDVSVTYNDGLCPISHSSHIHMKSVPCGPVNIHMQVQCGSGGLQITWNQTDAADGYTASVVSTSTGSQLYCNSTSPSCSLNSLKCGNSYTLQIRSYNKTCFSLPSQPLNIKEVPCPPTNVMVSSTCGSSTVVSWQASSGALSYSVTALSVNGSKSACSSNGTACTLTGLQCGQVYNISVTAINDICTSLPSYSSVPLQTVPCAPTNVHGFVQCTSNAVSLIWDSSPRAVTYTGKGVGSDGHTVTCNSTLPACQLTGLHCGQNYTFRVVASDGTCVSSDSSSYTQSTAPCTVQGVSNVLHCEINSISVNWVPAASSLNYSVLATLSNTTALSCTSSNSGCDITGLQCGQTYSISVTATSRVCTGPSSALQTVQTAPCVPVSVHASVTCASNTVRASWGQTQGALSYTSVLTGPRGYTQSCTTSSLSCSFSNLTCAQNYTLRVVSSNIRCNSTVSPGVIVKTVPCDPGNVYADLQCDSGAVYVSWQNSPGISVYTVLAYGQNQTVSSSSCLTSNTFCNLTQLQCGSVFNIIVLASDSNCNSSSNVATSIKTAPCPPKLQVLSQSCINNQALVSWTNDQDALGVSINATSVLGYSTTCISANHSCTLPGLQCGQTYTVRGTIQGLYCDSNPSAPVSLVTVPCTPAVVSVDYGCGTSVAVLSWSESLGRQSFVASVVSQDNSKFCTSNQTHCTVSSLLCGHSYNVSVQAVAGQCNSSGVARTQLQTAPCAPQNVSVSLQCANDTASVSWLASPGAVGYNVTALGHDGDLKFCNTSKTSCNLPNMHCAQTYDIVATPYSATCGGPGSRTVTFIAGPCPPTGVQASLHCENNSVYVSWVAAPRANMYIATATGNDGHIYTCSTNTTSCSILGLQCGNVYIITVVTMERGCQSQPSLPVTLKSAICPPTNLTGYTSCNTNAITITWSPSPVLGATYLLFSQQVGGLNSTKSTTATSVTLTGLQCSFVFIVQVAAQDNTCTSSYSAAVQLYTAPCTPSGLTATAECGTNLGHLSWLGVPGSLLYIATLVSDQGHSVACTSNTTSCTVKLACGHNYQGVVVSSTGSCNSTGNSSISFDSAPCLASNVQAQLDCNANSLNVQWSPLRRHPKIYTALAVGSDGSRFSCNSTNTNCTIPGLDCGNTYGVAVTASSIQCYVQGSEYQVQSAPCMAENPAVSVSCATNIATVTWDTFGAQQSYRVSALNFTGGGAVCVSNGSSCSFSQFSCGETYTVTITGVTQQCTSQPSTSVEFRTAPCTPTNVFASYDCATSITTVTWDMSRGADSYIVYVVDSNGNSTNCTNTDTSCSFPYLPCGQNYSVTVMAIQDGCTSLPSQPATVTTGPCPHSNVQISLDCSSNSAVVSWTPGRNILFYNVSADNFNVASHVTCSTTGSSCNLTHLQCSELYQISVSGQGSICSTSPQGWKAISTAPCPPTQVSVQYSCSSGIATVSWLPSQGPLFYLAVAQSSGGHNANCSNNGTSCNIAGLDCGQEYQIYVSGVDKDCVGARSAVQVLKTAPCVPQNVQTVLGCQSTFLNVTWQQKGEATHYQARVQSSDGRTTYCGTDKLSCAVPNIVCGLTYNTVVIAQNENCNSSLSSAQNAISAPCPPSAITAVLDCASNTISVNWSSSVPGVLYMVQAISSTGFYACNSTSTGCKISVPCGMTYNVTVVPIQNGCAGPHSPYKIIRAGPCVPTLTNVEMDCLDDSAWVMWNKSLGVDFYTAFATDFDGNLLECTSNGSMCAVPSLACGKHYNFSVTAFNSQCRSAVSNAVISETAPCAPVGVNASVGCLNGTVNVWWNRIFGALSYTAVLERSDGNTSHCTARNTHSCVISSLPCGQMHILTVTAQGRTCNSSRSTPYVIRTGPCTPVSPTSTVSCSNNVATVSWANSTSSLMYTVHAVSADQAFSASCQTVDGSCELTSLACGQVYAVTLVARDNTCVSLPSAPSHFTTVPCVPPNVTVAVDCQAHIVNVSWALSAGASFYTASLMDSWGHYTNCESESNSCNISGLACGSIYHASVVASDPYCSSKPSIIVDTYPIPCPPSNIQAVMDCQTDSALLSWQPSDGALEYTATALSPPGHAMSCQNNETNCELFRMLCGSKYQISVYAVGHSCKTAAYLSGYVETGPCAVENVVVFYTPPVGQVSWDISGGAVNYVVHAVTQDGLQDSCSSKDTSCALYNLTCSQTYSLTITANNNICQGLAVSAPVTVNTEPCPPTNVHAHGVCSSDEVVVTWTASARAVSYVVVLEGRKGDTLSCKTTETFCSVYGVQCGTAYVTTVKALSLSLNSSNSDPVLYTTDPCLPDPSSVTVTVGCDNDTASISWALTDGNSSHEISAISNDGYTATCTSHLNYCNLIDLVCGQTYSVNLTTTGSVCPVAFATNITFHTRPCTPQQVAVNLKCGTSTAVLSWEQSLDVDYYQARATFWHGGAALLCNSTTDTCQFRGLQCGTHYSFTVRAYTHQCHSNVSSTVYISTDPCQPQHLTVDSTCENSTVVLKWDAAAGALWFIIFVQGNLGYTNEFLTNVPILSEEFPCGQNYNFTVIGQDNRCYSPESTNALFTTAPCIPLNVESLVLCESNVGSISWASSDGADSYTVVASGQQGGTHVCNTNATVCTWNDLQCGEIYTVRVIASNLRCSSSPSNSTVIHMAPCVPQGVVSSINCDLKVVSVTWLPSYSAQFYVVTAENTPHQVELTTNQTSTQISEILCGQQYYFTVVAVGQVCRSGPSNASMLYSEPCPPSSVTTSVDCISSIATVSWAVSATADHYTAKVLGSDGQIQSCMSSSPSCGIATLQCGLKYNVTVTASNQLCSSVPSQQTYLNTAPCVPVGVSVTVDCTKNVAVVSWNASQGALSYQAQALSGTNDVLSCNSTGSNTNCVLANLSCGGVYTVHVVAFGKDCSSLPSQPSVFQSVPCSPNFDSVHLNCSTNFLLLDWIPSGSSVSYTAVAKSTSGQVSSCSTNFNSCVITQLACGQTYNVSLTASNGQCSSKQSNTLQVSSVPCLPVNVSSSINCSSTSAHVQWDSSSRPGSYNVYAIGSRGDVSGCNTTLSSCNVPNLQCGSVYNISVAAITNQCAVTNSAVTQLHTVPCVPVPQDTILDCVTGQVTMFWQPSQGAITYTAVAHGYAGFASSCNSSSTTCVFANLMCGLSYSFSVSASDNVCSSVYSHGIYQNSVPCQPQMLNAHTDCQSNTGLVSWVPEGSALFYLVQAVGTDGHQIQCHNTNTSCSLPNLHCGEAYNLSVTTQGHKCNSSMAHLILQSVPCVPTGVQASLLCSSNSAPVTWQTSSGALGYLAQGISADGLHTVTCNSSLSHCNLQQLHCGTTYSVTVAAMDNICTSGQSASAQIHTAPCPPQNVSVQTNCSAGALTITWAANLDAESFHVNAMASNGGNLSCDTSSTSCSISGLPCGSSYSVTVRSVRGGCQSNPSAPVQASSAPCIPQGESGSLDCVTNSVWVTWQQTAGAASYKVLAVAPNGTQSTCTSSSLFCNVPNLLCGVLYTFHITAVNAQCASRHGKTFQVQTAPCFLMGVSAVTQCNSTSITVSWKTEAVSSFFVATAEGQDLSFLECNSTSTSCVLYGARCDMQYTIIISTSSDKCNSIRSQPYYINTAPCTPVGVTVMPQCDFDGAVVSWLPSAQALSYSLTARGQAGDVHTCSGPAANCTLSHLQCGQSYTVSLSASNGKCTSASSQSLTFQTVPCGPQNLVVTPQCGTNSATLSWSASPGSVRYISSAQTSLGYRLYCNTTGTTCSIVGLQCGTVYNFSVGASNGICNGPPSQPLQVGAAPCAPATVTVKVHNEGEAILVRVYWSQVACPNVEYLAELSGRLYDDPFAVVQVSSYWTSRTYFEFLLPCDIFYNVTVRSRNQAGTSGPSASVGGPTVPCPLPNVNNSGIAGRRRRDLREAEMLALLMDKEALSAPEVVETQVIGTTLYLEWTPVTDASHYTLIVTEDTPSPSIKTVLTVYDNMSDVPDLQPGTRYCVVVTAKNSNTQSPFSFPKCVTIYDNM